MTSFASIFGSSPIKSSIRSLRKFACNMPTEIPRSCKIDTLSRVIDVNGTTTITMLFSSVRCTQPMQNLKQDRFAIPCREYRNQILFLNEVVVKTLQLFRSQKFIFFNFSRQQCTSHCLKKFDQVFLLL